jgi:hypothetical protein
MLGSGTTQCRIMIVRLTGNEEEKDIQSQYIS